jgi:hypothetical protein
MMRSYILLTIVVVVETFVVAQTPTLPEQVAAAQADVMISSHSDGPTLTFGHILAETDFVVRARVGTAVPYLTKDGRDIYTTYNLVSPQVLYASKIVQSATPG